MSPFGNDSCSFVIRYGPLLIPYESHEYRSNSVFLLADVLFSFVLIELNSWCETTNYFLAFEQRAL